MKICILYGSPRKKNTYAAVQVIKEQLNRLGKVDYNEYFLQTESHDFCCGCYTCIEGHEEKCPHAAHVQPVIQAMRDADGLIFATPVYVMDMTAQMKAFLDHTGYFYMVHRPYPEMFQKSALVISTAAGGGTKDANASIARSLKHWGVRRIFPVGFPSLRRDGMPFLPLENRASRRNSAIQQTSFGALWERRSARPYIHAPSFL
ncbi:flavodoxin family protein [Anaeromassilibacillus sp. SJQ-1]|uniref:flavodoxin family protein n=1 Tax=Anaeromassilibacillus sp. SJQ-1 TaxID=3375419 RepID=UPI003989E3C5